MGDVRALRIVKLVYFSNEGIVAYRIAVLTAFYAHNRSKSSSYIYKYKFANI